MIRYLSFLLLLAACGNNQGNHSNNDTGTATHGGSEMHRNTHQDNASPRTDSGNALPSMHSAMNAMMDSMHAYKPTGSADHDFAALMRLHHKSAVEMAQAELQGGQDSSMRNLAQSIVTGQRQEINLFNTFLQSNPSPRGGSAYGKQAMGMMTHMSDMHMQGGSIDHMFATMMIPHHQDGVKMAEAYLKEGKDATLLDAARNIVRTQPQEVKQLEQWLARHPR